MAKPLKILLGVVGALVLLIVIAVITLPLLFDPNDYRDEIAQAVKDRTGRELTISGEIDLKVFPWLGARIGETSLGNAPGFGPEPFARIGEVDVSVQLLPLILRREVRVGTVDLEGLRLNLAKDAQGRDNWSDLVEKQAEAPETPPPTTESGVKISAFDIGAIEIKDAALSYADAQAGKRYAVQKIDLETGSLAADKPINLHVDFVVEANAPQMTAEVDLVGLMTANIDEKQITADKLSMELIASGPTIPGGKQSVSLAGNLGFNYGSGALKLGEAKLQAAGIAVMADIEGDGLLGETPRLGGQIKVPTFSPRGVIDALKIEMPKTRDDDVLREASLSARYDGTFSSAKFTGLEAKLDKTTLSGNLSVTDFATQAIRFALKVDSIDADSYLPPEPERKDQSDETATPGGDINDIQIPVELLNQINAVGTFDIGTLKIKGLTLNDVQLKVDAPQGNVKKQSLAAKGYGGSFNMQTSALTGSPPTYTTQLRLDTINAGPLVKDFMDKDLVSGIGTLSLDLSSQGKTVGAMRKAMDGQLALTLNNGAVKGFNLAQMIRKARATLSGETLKTTEPEQTDFAAMSLSAQINDGVLSSNDLDARNPLLRLAGEGQINLVNETIDYLAKPTIVETSQGQGGEDLAELRGLTIPVRVTGSLFDPKVKLDLQSALKQKATEKVRQELKDKEDEYKEKAKEKINEKLGDGAADALRGLFGKKKKEEPAPAEAPPSEDSDGG